MARHLLLVVTAMVAVAQLVARATGYPWPECGGNKTFKANSKYQANLNHVAAMLPNKASASAKLFATAAAGVAPDRVWAMGLCRGDSDAASCFACLTQGFQDLPNDCCYDKEATIYYDACILHYSDARVLSAADTGLSADTYAQPFLVNITSDQARFNGIVADLMNATAEYAARVQLHATVRHRGGRLRPGVSQGVQPGAVHAGPDAGAVPGVPRRDHSVDPGGFLRERPRSQGALGQLQLPVRGGRTRSRRALLQWAGDGPARIIDPCSAGAGAGVSSSCASRD
jgi:hypothetical protein